MKAARLLTRAALNAASCLHAITEPRPLERGWSGAFLRNLLAVAAVTLAVTAASAQNQHKVTNRASPAQEPGAEREKIPSLVEGLHSADDWWTVRRPELLRLWTRI